MSHHRIDPTRIKTADNAPRARGGQGVVVVGTLIPPEGVEGLGPEVVEKFFHAGDNESRIEALKEMLPEDFEEAFPERVKEAVFRVAKSLFLTRKVAVKELQWSRDDAEESAKFFKVFVALYSLSHDDSDTRY